MPVRDTWVTLDGQRTRYHGHGRRWQAVWTSPGGKRVGKAFADRGEAALYAAEMQAATQAARSAGFSLLALVREVTARRDRWDAGTLAAELRRRIPAGHEEAALMAALEAVAATAVALQGGPWRSPARPNGGRPRTTAQAAKDAQAASLHQQSKSYQEIADAMGWRSKATAFHAVQRGLADQAAQHPAPSGDTPAAVA